MSPAPRRLQSALAATAALVTALAGSLALASRAAGHPFHPTAEAPDTTAPGLQLKRIGSFKFPLYVASPPGDRHRQFVVQQDGRIKIVKDGQTLARPFLDISPSGLDLVDFNHSERGLLSMAFPPDYAETRRFYVFYTAKGGDLHVDELKAAATDPDVAKTTTRRTLLAIEHSSAANHNGGQLQFTPDGRLFISTGDGGGSENALRHPQSLGSLLGKILRIDPRRPSGAKPYSIPRGNPFVGRTGRDEIWAYGLRNPWRFSFDRDNGNMAIGDVGQTSREEIDFTLAGRKGMNFGWSCWEGTVPYNGCTAPGHVRPVLEYPHEGGGSCAVTGGFVLRDASVARLFGKYIYGDYCTGALHAVTLRESGATGNESLSLVVPWLTGFGEDAQGRLYATSRGSGTTDGTVYRLRTAP